MNMNNSNNHSAYLLVPVVIVENRKHQSSGDATETATCWINVGLAKEG